MRNLVLTMTWADRLQGVRAAGDAVKSTEHLTQRHDRRNAGTYSRAGSHEPATSWAAMCAANTR